MKSTQHGAGGWSTFSLRGFSYSAAGVILVLLALCAAFVDYGVEGEGEFVHTSHVRQYYSWLQDTMLMVFFGFGLLMCFLRRYGYTAIGLNFFLSVIVMVEAVLLIGAVQQVWGKGASGISLDLPLLTDAAFCAASAMIAFGAIIGKATPAELLWLLVTMVPLYAVNQRVVFHYISALDVGGSITIHVFGAYYGLAASLALSAKQTDYKADNTKNGASYNSNLFSMIGTLFLWMFWPSFNGALASVSTLEATGGEVPDAALEQQQYLCVVNTLVSLLGSCASTFIVSSLIHNRFDMVHVQNATLAGGVAAGSGAALHLSPAGALAVGLTAGALSTLGFTYLTPALERSINLGDTCGVNNLHGLPGILGGVVAGLASFGAINAHVAPHGTAQLGWQIVGIICTVGIGGIGGWVAGYVAAASNPQRQRVDGVLLFDDGLFWTEESIEMVNRDGSVMGVPSVHGGEVYTRAEGRPAQLEAAVGGMAAGLPGKGVALEMGNGGGGANNLVVAVADEGPSGSGSRIASGDTGARGDQAA